MKKKFKNEIRDIVKMQEIIGEAINMKNETYLKIIFAIEDKKINLKQGALNGDVIQKEKNIINIFLDSLGIYFRIDLDEDIKAKNYGIIMMKIKKSKTLLYLLDYVGSLNTNVSVLKFLPKI